ncbi:MAG: GGDEF domain-containing protein [Enterobacterales bacterium]|nr:GGDEF domain-containing protein [Enterobacterales bacterium]
MRLNSLKSLFQPSQQSADSPASEDPSHYRRYFLTSILLVIALVTFILFIFINWALGKISLVYFDMFASSLITVALYFLWVKKNVEVASCISSLIVFLFLLAFSYINQSESFSLAWTFCFPLFVIPLLGLKRGCLVIALFYTLLTPMVYWGIGKWDYGQWDQVSFLRFILITSIIIFIAYFYESTSQKAFKAIAINRKIEKRYMRELETHSYTDPLTQLYNRRYFEDQFEVEYNKIDRYKNSFCLIMVDIDHFKLINDEKGHQVGDLLLQEFSALLTTNTRSSDILCRWGGEEFMLLLPNSDRQKALAIAEKLRENTRLEVFSCNVKMTISLGLIEVSNTELRKRSIMNRVDQALYQAKSTGRNKVVVASL